MAQHGRRRAAPTPRPTTALLAHLVGLVAATAAWVVMVAAAVDSGRQGRDGSASGWVFLAVGTGGAVACLLLALLLGARILLLLGVRDGYRPRRARRH